MRRRLSLDDEGYLCDRSGHRLGKLVSLTVELEGGEGSGGDYRGGERSGGSGVPQTLPFSEIEDDTPDEGGVGETKPERTSSADIEKVWARYCEVMTPRNTTLSPEERTIIRAALKVATVEELCECIVRCSQSPFHMGVNDKHRKYNRLTQIIKGRQGKETTRERIDFWLDMETPDGSSSAKIPQGARFPLDLSGMDPVTVGTVRHRRQTVRTMYENPNDEYAQRVGHKFEEWLREKIGHKPVIVDGRVTGWDYA